ncbi:aminotransferase class I/II-fold pyridoxal phosphate-dependent enzyme [Roseateles sp. DAIF2]|nr:aminotransferase class I/II-fold pyridoxal phosphate-dependent enzyme [Roseateles sp. DAIF2]
MPLLPEHGGPDGGPAIQHDFSTNANPLGPPLALLRAVQDADRGRYPDPQYGALRERLGAAHGLPAARVLVASGGAEAIRRLSLAALLEQGCREVWVPSPGFGDYALAARALGLAVFGYAADELPRPQGPALVWVCEPNNPSGAGLTSARLQAIAAASGDALLVVDRAYEALRLDGEPPAMPPGCWQLICPNKALGLTGVRAAYLLAPTEDALWARALSLAPSWVLSAEGVALLGHWHAPATTLWLDHSREQLQLWRAQLRGALARRGWEQRESQTNFWLVRPPRPLPVQRLRAAGIKLRDAASLGAPGWWRLAALPAPAQQALLKELSEP